MNFKGETALHLEMERERDRERWREGTEREVKIGGKKGAEELERVMDRKCSLEELERGMGRKKGNRRER